MVTASLAHTIRILRNFTSRKISVLDTKVLNSLLKNNGINLLDIGAAGGIEPRWKKISKKINYFGYEPGESSGKIKPNIEFFSYQISSFAVGDAEKKTTFNITQDIEKSSLFFPNYGFLERFPNNSRFSVTKQIELQTVRIDSQKNKDIDFIKLDIQGGELNALRGSEGILENVLGIEVEIEFMKLYAGQPLFGSIYDYLAMKDFEFIDFVNLSRWERKSFNGLGQLVFGDALFLRSPEKLLSEEVSEGKLTKYLAILYIYNRFDLIEKIFSQKRDLKFSLKEFYNYQKKKSGRLRGINSTNRVITAIYSLFGVELRSHVVY